MMKESPAYNIACANCKFITSLKKFENLINILEKSGRSKIVSTKIFKLFFSSSDIFENFKLAL